MTRLVVPWDEIETQWEEREYGALRDTVSRLLGFAAQDVEALLLETEPTPEVALRVLDDAFAAAGLDTDARLALALYVYSRCLERWEQTEDYEPIRTVVTALEAAAREADGTADARSELLAIVVGQAQLLDVAMSVEDAMNCSCPVAMGARAGKVVGGLVSLLERERELGDGPARLRAIVRSDAEMTRRYFEAIADMAKAVERFVDRDAPGPAAFHGVLESLIRAERAIARKGDVYESELRAHRATLEALRDRAEEPRLRVDAAEVVYLYPFALDIDAEKAVERTLRDDFVRVLTDAGLRPARVHELELNDLWDRRDVPEPGYSAVSIELPPIAVTTTAREGEPRDDDGSDDVLQFTAEVRLSRLGNHHVRVLSRLEKAGLHEVNQALRRGSHGMGEEELMWEGETRAQFPLYADHVIDTIATALRTKAAVRNLDATFHVVLAATSISLQRLGGRTRPAALGDLKPAVGASLLFHPVRHLTTSLEEWVRYPPPDVTNLLEGQGYEGDLVVQTDNTTVTYMPASPEWLIDEYEEMIEFVASFPPLLTLWENRALQLGEELDEVLAGLEWRIQANDDPIGELHEQEMRIRELESDIRRQLAFLHSPALCRTRAQRRFLDDLWSAAGLPALETELERRLTLLAERQERIAAMASSIDERHRQKLRERAERLERPVQILALFLTAAGILGVFAWAEGAFDDEALAVWAWVETTVLVAVVLFVGAMLWRRRDSPPSSSRAEVHALRDLDADNPDDELLDRFHREVLATSFPPDELEDSNALARGVRGDGDTEVLVSIAVDGGGAVLGGVVGEVYARERVLLLSYLAVRGDLRARGIGTALMEHVAQRWYAHPAVRLALAEVHDPRYGRNVAGADPLGRLAFLRRLGFLGRLGARVLGVPFGPDVAGADPLGRLRFFDRFGARVLGVPFVQPALGPAHARVPGFLLLAVHVHPSVDVRRDGANALRSDVVGGFVHRYYETAEGGVAPDDAELNDLLRRIEEHPTIELLPVADYESVPLGA